MKILPVNDEWIHNYFMMPYLQGCERINRAVKGVDFQPIIPVSLTLRERVVSCLTGMLLMLPAINLIAWIAWQTFGHPEEFPDPYCPEPEYVVLPYERRVPMSSSSISIRENEPELPEEFDYQETHNRIKYTTDWTIRRYPHKIDVERQIQSIPTIASYTYDWTLKEFFHYTDKERYEYSLNPDGKSIKVRIQKQGGIRTESLIELKENIPWIQQPQVGMMPFIRSENRELSFYVVVPENFLKWVPFMGTFPTVVKCTARKVAEENGLIKVVADTQRFPFSYVSCEGWFDAKTGLLEKFMAIDSTGKLVRKTGERSHPLPESAHP